MKPIEELRTQHAAWQHNLNTEGIWLFITTLGCWSVRMDTASGAIPGHFLKIGALFLTLSIFLFRAYMSKTHKDSFAKRINDAIEKVRRSEATEADKNSDINELENLPKEDYTGDGFKRTWVFLSCWVFWIFSLIAAYFELTNHM